VNQSVVGVLTPFRPAENNRHDLPVGTELRARAPQRKKGTRGAEGSAGTRFLHIPRAPWNDRSMQQLEPRVHSSWTGQAAPRQKLPLANVLATLTLYKGIGPYPLGIGTGIVCQGAKSTATNRA